MATSELINYIKNQLKLGRSDDVIKAMLKNAGWQEADIDEALNAVSGSSANASVPQAPSGYSQNIISHVPVGAGGSSELLLAGAGALLKNSWQIYKSRFWVLVGVIVLQVVIIGGLSLFFIIPDFFAVALPKIIEWFSIFLIIPALIALIGWIYWSILALFFAIKDYQEAIGVIESYRRAWRRGIWSFFFLGILSGLIIMGGLMLLVVPAIIFAVWFIPAIFVFVAEGQKELSALLRSKEYVTGRWWQVAWRILFIFLIGLAIFLLFTGINYITPEIPAVLTSISILGGVVNVLLNMFYLTYIFSLYSALRETRPYLVSQPVSAKKGFFIFCAILGILAPILIWAVIFSGFLNFNIIPNGIDGINAPSQFLNGEESLINIFKDDKYGFEVAIPQGYSRTGSPKNTTTFQSDTNKFINFSFSLITEFDKSELSKMSVSGKTADGLTIYSNTTFYPNIYSYLINRNDFLIKFSFVNMNRLTATNMLNSVKFR